MKKAMKLLVIGILILIVIFGVVIFGGGKLLYKHFVTDQIMDGGNMENPNATQPETNARYNGPSPDGVWYCEELNDKVTIAGDILTIEVNEEERYSGEFTILDGGYIYLEDYLYELHIHPNENGGVLYLTGEIFIADEGTVIHYFVKPGDEAIPSKRPENNGLDGYIYG